MSEDVNNIENPEEIDNIIVLNDEDGEEVNVGINIMAFSPEIRESFKRMVQAFMKRGMSHADADRVALNRLKGQA